MLLPTWLITLLLIVLLLVLAYMTFTKAIKLHRKERKHAASLVPLGAKPDPNPVKGLQGPAPTQARTYLPPSRQSLCISFSTVQAGQVLGFMARLHQGYGVQERRD